MTPPGEGSVEALEERLLQSHNLVVQAAEKLGAKTERVRNLEEMSEYLKECSMPLEGSAVVEFASILCSRISSRPLTKTIEPERIES